MRSRMFDVRLERKLNDEVVRLTGALQKARERLAQMRVKAEAVDGRVRYAQDILWEQMERQRNGEEVEADTLDRVWTVLDPFCRERERRNGREGDL